MRTVGQRGHIADTGTGDQVTSCARCREIDVLLGVVRNCTRLTAEARETALGRLCQMRDEYCSGEEGYGKVSRASEAESDLSTCTRVGPVSR